MLCCSNLAAQERINLQRSVSATSHAFTAITSVRELPDGSVLAVDRGGNVLLHVASGDAPPETVGREGDGPAEYRRVGSLFRLGEDSTLLTDAYSGRWLLLRDHRIVVTVSESDPLNRVVRERLSGTDAAGHVLALHAASHAPGAPRLVETADTLVLVLGTRGRPALDTLASLRGSGSAGFRVINTGAGRPRFIITRNPLTLQDQALLFSDGWIAIARVAPYRVDWRTPDGRWLRGASLPFERIALSDREKCWAMAWFLGQRRDCDPSQLADWPDVVPAFVPPTPREPPVLFADPEGRLVIARTRTAGSPERRYDVVDRQGRLAATMYLDPAESIVGFGRRAVFTAVDDGEGGQLLRRHPWP